LPDIGSPKGGAIKRAEPNEEDKGLSMTEIFEYIDKRIE